MRLGQGRAGPHLGLRLCKGLRLCLGTPLGCCHPLRRGPTVHVTGAVRAVVILRPARHPAGCRECEAIWELARGRRGKRGARAWKWGAVGYSSSLPSGGGCRLCSWLALDHRRSFAHRGPCSPSPLKVAVFLTAACRVQDTAVQAAEWGLVGLGHNGPGLRKKHAYCFEITTRGGARTAQVELGRVRSSIRRSIVQDSCGALGCSGPQHSTPTPTSDLRVALISWPKNSVQRQRSQ